MQFHICIFHIAYIEPRCEVRRDVLCFNTGIYCCVQLGYKQVIQLKDDCALEWGSNIVDGKRSGKNLERVDGGHSRINT